MTQLQLEATGTRWTIDVYQDTLLPEDKIRSVVSEFQSIYSRFEAGSLVSTIAKKSGSFNFPATHQPLWGVYQKLYQLTDGLMTPLVGQVLVEAGYDRALSLKPGVTRTPPPLWEEVMELTYPHLHTKKPICLDFGAAGKGYLVDLVAQILSDNNITNYCVEAGGDMVYKTETTKKLRVGLENPNNNKQAIGVVEIKNKAICGSAGNRRRWGEFNHIFNPKTLESATNLAAVWVIANDTLTADALTTALYFCPAQKLKAEFDFEYLKLNNDFSIEKSEGFEVKLFTKHRHCEEHLPKRRSNLVGLPRPPASQ